MPEPTNTTAGDKVRLRLDRPTGMWVVTGRGQSLRFKSYEIAEVEALRRAGVQKVSSIGVPRSR